MLMIRLIKDGVTIGMKTTTYKRECKNQILAKKTIKEIGYPTKKLVMPHF